MIFLNRSQTCIFLLAVLLLHLAADSRNHLEGIVEDPVNPANSVAIIGGKVLKTGEKIEGYKVEKISGGSVSLRDESGRSVILNVQGGGELPSPDVKTEEDSSENEPSGEAAALSVPFQQETDQARTRVDSLKPGEKSNPFWQQLQELLRNPAAIMNRVWEIQALSSLRRIHTAAMVYGQENDRAPGSMAELVKAGLLTAEFSSGQIRFYHFELTAQAESPDAAVRANPLDEKSGLSFFYLGADGFIHVSKDGPASMNSPKYQPMGFSGLMPNLPSPPPPRQLPDEES